MEHMPHVHALICGQKSLYHVIRQVCLVFIVFWQLN